MSNIVVERNGAIEKLTINRPDKLNALNKATIQELGACVKAAEADSSVKVIIITGSGDKAFVAGADISEFYQFSKEEAKALAKGGQDQLFDVVENCKTPVIAAINGFALGGGLELAMSCHIRVASENARMGLPEVSLGVIPGYGGTQRLAQLAGKGKAMELIFTAGMINAGEALQVGLVNYVVSQEELLTKCNEIATKIVKNSSVAIASAISAVNAGYTDGVNGYEKEIEAFANCFGSEDFKEGTSAFLEKRKANFPGK
ncbi:MAG: enoyl-CoA hydratase [Bacteroidetes bacterium]|nr:MAG: enoyl-CoA hydratase [Bacteroidota bacterium]MBL1143608.1 enoyl-CoA hydratase [Bacteroidota bacterium]NOG56410.1 enoyl-CoA hydratase [Bacteroidota bacterium]